MRATFLLVFSFAAAMAGCATFAHGTTQRVPISSLPQGARVLVDSVPVGVTPLVATVSRKQAHVVSVVHDSFPPVNVALDRNVSPWVLASLFFYAAPAVVDFADGAAYGFAGDTLRVVLTSRTHGELGVQPSGIRRSTQFPTDRGDGDDRSGHLRPRPRPRDGWS